MSSVAVIGAGVVGASVTYHLARLGVPVTLIDGGSSPAAGVTGDSFAWIGDSGGDWPGGAEDLRGSVLSDYRRVEAEVPGVAVRWTGSLAWTDTSVRLGEGARPGRGQVWVGRDDIAALEPHLDAVPDQALHCPTDGAVDPAGLTQALVQAARGLGARIIMDAAAVSLTETHGRVQGVMSTRGFHGASIVVLAAGTGTTALSEQLGVRLPVVSSPAFLMRVAAPAGLIKTIVATPDFEAREIHPGHLVGTAPLQGGESRESAQELAEHTLERLRTTFRSSKPLRLLGWRISGRPMPANGPLLGYLTPDRSTYVAVMHSAVTLAPTVGRLVARELATGQAAVELRRCRPRH